MRTRPGRSRASVRRVPLPRRQPSRLRPHGIRRPAAHAAHDHSPPAGRSRRRQKARAPRRFFHTPSEYERRVPVVVLGARLRGVGLRCARVGWTLARSARNRLESAGLGSAQLEDGACRGVGLGADMLASAGICLESLPADAEQGERGRQGGELRLRNERRCEGGRAGYRCVWW